MVQRAILSQKLVDQAEIPASKNEHWIADTKQRGFGLRLWRNPRGQVKKAYCIRTTNSVGKSIRKTLPLWLAKFEFQREKWWDIQFEKRHSPTMGECIEIARNWAQDQIDIAKGRPTLHQEEEAQKYLAKKRAEALSLEGALQKVVDAMETHGLSQPYRDRIDKLVGLHLPSYLGEKSICDVTLDDVRNILRSPSLTPGNLRLLRPIIGRALDIPNRFGTHTQTSSYHFRRLSDELAQGTAMPEQLQNWEPVKFENFITYLESSQEKWQQAYCLRLYLEFYVPLTLVMSARWIDIGEYLHTPQWGQNPQPKRRVVWMCHDASWKWQAIRPTTERVLVKCLERCRKEFEDSEFLFPSQYGRTVEHIRSVDHVWREAIHKFNLTYISPKQFKTAFRETHPWFGLDFDW